MTTAGPPWRCPACGLPLHEDASGAWCDAGHRVDRAREGYLHLLPAGRLKGRVAGDAPEMLAARRAVFDAGHYRPVHEAVAAAVHDRRPRAVLDAGCGEGTYLDAVDAPARLGIDIAKAGIRLAARRYPDCRFAVASSFHFPLADATVDTVMSVFAPRAFAEFTRVLRPGGVAVLASPGPEHFAGITELIYGTPRRHEQRPHTADDPELPNAPVQRAEVRYDLTLTSPAAMRDLVLMTPYWWKATAEQQAALAGTASVTTTIDIVVTVHELG